MTFLCVLSFQSDVNLEQPITWLSNTKSIFKHLYSKKCNEEVKKEMLSSGRPNCAWLIRSFPSFFSNETAILDINPDVLKRVQKKPGIDPIEK